VGKDDNATTPNLPAGPAAIGGTRRGRVRTFKGSAEVLSDARIDKLRTNQKEPSSPYLHSKTLRARTGPSPEPPRRDGGLVE